jgi:hypothetical protein
VRVCCMNSCRSTDRRGGRGGSVDATWRSWIGVAGDRMARAVSVSR